ncbi:alkaline phosphatase [Ferrimonas lipolytica]|uniref:Alkaline phosphatase n=1 Tax=Ferrimonas lipolytica TaxID=2724191 RepID=A0A6H1UC88_9GAMM|nr:alkaline phosphatase [Ferrimonas lipolytica]QIZ76458.1 alkaline phosphatase [Ferrimonas lipolytica]
MKRFVCVVALPLALAVPAQAQSQPTAKNVIYMIGDGMGPAYLSAYRYYLAGKPGNAVAPTIFDQLLVGAASTYPDDDTWVTDSAASATALASGVKSYNGAIGLDTDKQPLPSILANSKRAGKTIGVVSTSQINHATPASFVAHVASRKSYEVIANQMTNAMTAATPELDLMFGGGLSYFSQQQLETMNRAGVALATNWQQLDEIEKLPAAALLAPVALPYAIDSDRDQRLATMTFTALSLAESNPKGFSLLIEGSLIDWCGHGNDIACAMKEMEDFAAAVTVAKDYVDEHPDTLLVVTADHSTGGLTLGADGEYQWLPLEVKRVHASTETIANALLHTTAEHYAQEWSKYVDFELTNAELTELALLANENMYTVAAKIGQMLSVRSFTGWTTTGHTAVDVPVMAYGVGAEQFTGYQDNTDIPKKIINILAID